MDSPTQIPVKKEYPRSGTFTFKRHVGHGRFKSFDLDFYDVKHKGTKVGSIMEVGNRSYDQPIPGTEGKYRIRFMIKKEPTKEDPAPFQWILLKYIANDADDAKAFINAHANAIHQKYDLYHSEDYI